MNSNKKVLESKDEEINIKVIEQVLLTPLTCASLVNEVLKCLLYQKSQIPYPYNWMKNVVKKKRSNPDVKNTNLQAERHYHSVCSAYDSLEKIMDSIAAQFKDDGSNIKKILIIFGSTPYSAKEVYTINISGVVIGHVEKNHLNANSKHQYKILRDIFFSDEWINTMDLPMVPTNTYVIIEKVAATVVDELSFQSVSEYVKLPSVKNVYINLNYHYDGNHNCCNDLLIFQDLNKDCAISNSLKCTESNEINNSSERDTDQVLWIQNKTFVRGFKECFINGISATELW
ncbi:hypothetical protein PPYR_01512 [Photinus pyralis]|uniref:MAD2L1-binding protein n=2 Tax=Photinus pyralis TaxID=7054 RepID=A0A5N4B4M3_PHOPY|nr:uncharacterized protein LOC116162216 [Photinus pyralis]KAB0804542.1 hypothetical protein PPYR_01512 [Photinus pyralis]